MNGWMRAIDDALVTHHLGIADESDSYEEAKRKLGELIDWHVAVATDPRVNGGWQLVPVEPTREMVKAGDAALIHGDGMRAGECMTRGQWRLMLAALPTP